MLRSRNEDVRHSSFRLLLLREAADGVALAFERGSLKLPQLALDGGFRLAELCQRTARERWKAEVILLAVLDATDLHPLIVAEELSSAQIEDLLWFPIDTASSEYLTKSEREALFAWMHASEPTSHMGWASEAVTWIETATGRRVPRPCSLEQLNGGSGFQLLRVAVEDRSNVWLKATSYPNRHELGVTAALARFSHGFTPSVLASHADWNAWLMPEVGSPVTNAIGEHISNVAAKVAMLQMSSGRFTAELMAAGVFDQQPQTLHARLPELFSYLTEAMGRQTSTRAEKLTEERLREMLQMTLAVAERVGTSGFPSAILHGDLNRGNVLIGPGGCHLIDWAEAYVGWPLTTLENLLRWTEDENLSLDQKLQHPVVRAYRHAWLDVVSGQAFDRALGWISVMGALSTLYGRGHWLGTPAQDLPEKQAFARTMARNLDRALRLQEQGASIFNTVGEPVMPRHKTAPDSFLWLEEAQSDPTQRWIREQQSRCDAYFQQTPAVEAIREEIDRRLSITSVDQPAPAQEAFFFRRRAADEEQGSIFMQSAGILRRIVDADALGRYASVALVKASRDGSLFAYSLGDGGSSKRSVHVLSTDESLQIRMSLSAGRPRGLTFDPDGNGCVYCQDRPGMEEHTIVHHSWNGDSNEVVLFRRPESLGSRLALLSDKTHLGALHVQQDETSSSVDLWIATRSCPGVWKQVAVAQPLQFSPVLWDGKAYYISYEACSNGVVCSLDLRTGATRIEVYEQRGSFRQVLICRGRLYIVCATQDEAILLTCKIDSHEAPRETSFASATLELLPSLVEGQERVFARLQSYTQPPALFEVVQEDDVMRPWPESTAASSPALKASLETSSYRSSDGPAIPVDILRPPAERGPREPRAVLMTAYGGFGVSSTPQHSILVSTMLELGVAFALPKIRGGGDFGKSWHDAARGRKRQVAINDFIAAAEWLRNEVFPNRPLAIFGGSNAGLLVAAAMTQRPELFRAVLCIAPLLDMVRFEALGAGSRWREEYGTAENEQDLQALLAYSPYHHVYENVDYPSILFITGDKDDRCNPAHVRKMAALLQSRAAQHSPVLVDYSAERGHAPVMPKGVRVEALTRRIAFLCRELDVPVAFGGGA